MKLLTIFLTVVLLVNLSMAKDILQGKIDYYKDGKKISESYFLQSGFKNKKNQYVLKRILYVKAKKHSQKQVIAKAHFETLKGQLVGVIWDIEAKKFKTKDCQLYAKLQSAGSKADVCLQDKAIFGKTYGMLHKYSKFFE